MYFKKTGLLLGLCILPACTPLESPVDRIDQLQSDPQPVFHGDSIYLLSRAAGCVLQVTPGEQGKEAYTEQEAADVTCIGVGTYPQSWFASKDGNRMLVITQDSAQKPYLASVNPDKSCKGNLPFDTGCVTSIPMSHKHDRLELSPDGRFAISYYSPYADTSSEGGIVNPNEVEIFNLETGESQSVTVGYHPKTFAFTTQDPSHPRVVMLTDTLVVLLDLVTGEITQRELTLSTDTSIYPSGLVLSGDESLALVTIEGSTYLFTFDLTQETLPINILSLSGYPGAMGVSHSGNRLVVIADGTEVNFVDLNDLSIEVETVSSWISELTVAPTADYLIGWTPDYAATPLYYIDTVDTRVQGYDLQNPIEDVRINPDSSALFLTYLPDYTYTDASLGSHYAVAVLNLAQGDRQPSPLLVDSLPRDVAFSDGSSPSDDWAFFPLDLNYDYSTNTQAGAIVRLNLSDYSTELVQTAPYGTYIGTINSGERLVVVHSAATGFMSIFPRQNPEQLQFITDYMLTGLFNDEE